MCVCVCVCVCVSAIHPSYYSVCYYPTLLTLRYVTDGCDVVAVLLLFYLLVLFFVRWYTCCYCLIHGGHSSTVLPYPAIHTLRHPWFTVPHTSPPGFPSGFMPGSLVLSSRTTVRSILPRLLLLSSWWIPVPLVHVAFCAVYC